MNIEKVDSSNWKRYMKIFKKFSKGMKTYTQQK